MAKKSESTSSQTGLEPAIETQLEDLGVQVGNEAAIPGVDSEREGPSEADIETFTDIAKQLERELCSIVFGQERVIRKLLLPSLPAPPVSLERYPSLAQ